MRRTVLIVDDDAAMASLLRDIAAGEGHDVRLFTQSVEALDAARKTHFDCILLDLMMPVMNGLAFLKAIKAADERTEVVVITGRNDVELAVRSIKAGAFDYLVKPVVVPKLVSVLRGALAKASVPPPPPAPPPAAGPSEIPVASPASVSAPSTQTVDQLHGMIAASAAMKRLLQRIRQVAPYFSVLLISGPPGSGKDLVAGAVHKESDRAKGRLVSFNCAAVAAEGIEGLLFGATGAAESRPSLLEQARGGVLLLDQVERLPLSVQNKLLGFIDTGEYTRAGDVAIATSDAKIMAATSLDLRARIEAGQFLDQLYYRLSRIELAITPLAQRKEDVNVLARVFLARFTQNKSLPAKGFTPVVWSLFSHYPWEGNVRELKGGVESAALIATGVAIGIDDLPKNLVSFAQKHQELLSREVLSSISTDPARETRSRK